MIHVFPTDFLPAPVHFRAGSASDYRALERFHYLPQRPATWAGVRVATCVDAGIDAGTDTQTGTGAERVIAVAVLSYPSALHRTRHKVFELKHHGFGERIAWANANVRTISRVIVHPQFRSIGLARVLIKQLIDSATTRYVEASARMGRAHPLFERAGMHRVEPASAAEPVYYWIDRTRTTAQSAS
ncbi:MAG: GNAT family N-acetyltransferase [Burkholderiales bacterium]|nr:GNAT family N-acetyltransferase [Phycisphaerae bacterium]